MAIEISFGQQTISVALYDPNTLAARGFAEAAATSASQAAGLVADTTAAIGHFVNQEVSVEDGYWNPTTGAAQANAAYQRWTLAVAGGEVLSISGIASGDVMALASFFDDEGDLVGSPFIPGVNAEFERYENQQVTVPAGAVLAKGSAWNFDVTVPGFEAIPGGKRVTVERLEIDTERADEVQTVLNGLAYVRKAWSPSNGYYGSTGSLTTNASWKHQVFEIKAGQYIRVENVLANGSPTAAIVFGQDIDGGTGQFGEVTAFYDVGTAFDTRVAAIPRQAPPRTTHVAVTTLGTRAVRVFISEPQASFGRDCSDTVAMLNPLRGKTAVWFGTSIPAGDGIAGSYVDRVATATGMTIYNEAIGGSAARGGIAARRATGDTYGWTGAGYPNLRVAMGKSDAECTDLIDNWVRKWRDRVIGTKPAASALSSEEQAVIRGSSYEAILDPYLVDGNVPDYFIFDHGYNDWGWAYFSESSPGVGSNLYDMTTVPGTRFDRATFIGAMEFYFNRIWAVNPRARIILIGHNVKGSEDDISDGQLLLQNRTNYPLMRLWEVSGFNSQVIVGGDADGETVYKQWNPDDIHPHSDATGFSNDHLGSLIARWLVANA